MKLLSSGRKLAFTPRVGGDQDNVFAIVSGINNKMKELARL